MAFTVTSYSEAAVQRATTRVSAAQLCTAAVGLFVVLVTLLHFIEPEFGPMWRFVSEYSNGAYGWVMRLAFGSMAVGCAAAIVAIRPHAHTKPAIAGLFFLGIAVVGLVMAGLFNQDPITSNVTTREGNLHAFATMLGIPGFVLASLLLGGSLARRWTSARTELLVLSTAPLITFVSMPIYMAIVMPSEGGFGPAVWVGFINRLFLVAMCGWLLFVAGRAGSARQ